MTHLLKAALISSMLVLINACTSPMPQVKEELPPGAQYGTGPGYRIPAPQTEPPNLQGVKGAKITNERYSTSGNKDYRVLGKNYMVWRDITSYQEEGIASWYGPGFHGNKTSNGEHYDMNGYTAAHKNLPLPSFLKVTNLQNGKALIVRVNDRGPFHGNRILDLSKGAARALGVLGPGTAKVKVELIKTKINGSQTDIAIMEGFKPYIQVFVTDNYQKAMEIKNKVAQTTNKKAYIEDSNYKYRIKVGPLTKKDNISTMNKIKSLGFNNAFFTTK